MTLAEHAALTDPYGGITRGSYATPEQAADIIALLEGLLATQPDIPYDQNFRHASRSRLVLSMELRLREAANDLALAVQRASETEPAALQIMADAIAQMRASADQIRAAHDRMVEGMTGCNHAVVQYLISKTHQGQLQTQEANRESR